MTTKVTVWYCRSCKEEYELTIAIGEEAYCPRCGNEMKKRGGYKE